jgi:hypothetical protein
MKFRLLVGGYVGLHPSVKPLPNLPRMTPQQLADFAKNDGIDLTGCLNKKDVILRIQENYSGIDPQTGRIREQHYHALDPKNNIIESEVDLCKRHNQKGKEKFSYVSEEVLAGAEAIAENKAMKDRIAALEAKLAAMSGQQVPAAMNPTAKDIYIPSSLDEVHEAAKQGFSECRADNGLKPEAVPTIGSPYPGRTLELDKMTNRELRDYAAEEEIDVSGCTSKQELIARIKGQAAMTAA